MNTKRVMQCLSIVALMVWGGLFVYFYLVPAEDGSGPLIQKYVNAKKNFDLWVLIAGMGLIVLALFNLFTLRQKSGICNHEHAHGDECDHDHHHHDEDDDHDHSHEHEHSHEHHDHGEEGHDHAHDHEQTPFGLAVSILILIVPVLVAAKYSEAKWSPGYYQKLTQIETRMRALDIEKHGETLVEGADPDAAVGGEEETAQSNDVAEFTLEDLERMVPKSSAGNFMLDVPEIYFTAGDKQLRGVMEGIPVEFKAQVMNETVNNDAGNRLRGFRLMIECCAADARPISIPMEFAAGLPPFEEMGWFAMVGKLHYALESGEWVPILMVKTFEETTEDVGMLN